MNLEKLLKKIENNSQKAEEQKEHILKLGGESYKVLTMTRSEKRDFLYSRSTSDFNGKETVAEMVKWAKPFIYKSLQLSELAVKAMEEKYIKKYHDVIEMLFEPEEILEIIGFIMDINKIGATSVEENIEEIKKQ